MRTVPGPTEHVVIVGAGLGGLSAALHLAGAGHRVTVLERAEVPGGRCGLWAVDGYSFDTGPTVLTMPDILERPFAAVGESMRDWLELQRLDPAYRARFADGTSLDVHADPEALLEEIRSVCGPADADGFRRYIEWVTELYRLELPHFIDRNLDSVRELAGRPALQLLRRGALRRLAPKVGEFVRDERLRRLLTFQAMYAGLAPTQARSIYAVISYMDTVAGVYFPRGGMHAIPRALAGAGTKHGVEIRYGVDAARIETTGGRATAVITSDGERLTADVVIVNADRPQASARLLGRPLPRRRYSPSCVVVHFGSDQTLPDPTHHTIDFGSAWERTFGEIIKHGRLMSDPSFLLTTPTYTDPKLAPPGRQTYYALFPAPNLDHRAPIDWSERGPGYLDEILATLDRRGYAGLDAAEVTLLVTPADWAGEGLAAGTPFAAAHTLRQTGPLRESTIDGEFENLLFCGSNSQPGVGVPMVLLSGGLVARRVGA